MKRFITFFIAIAIISLPCTVNSQIKVDLNKKVITIDSKSKKDNKKEPAKESQQNKETQTSQVNEQNQKTKTNTGSQSSTKEQPQLQTYSNYDFIADEKVIFFDDFTSENIGDFPQLWNTNSSGEIVTTNLFPGRWFKITSGSRATCLMYPLTLPENYTIEYDVIPQKDSKNNGNTQYSFFIISTPKPKDIGYGLARPGGTGIKLFFAYNIDFSSYYSDGSPDLKGRLDSGTWPVADKKYRISIWVQKERIRVYQNEVKIYDAPRAMSKNFKYNMIRFEDGMPMISNVRVTTGLPDMRNKLITEGKLVMYGIYFDVNKDAVKPESYGMGETQPVAPNDTPVNKALNRRVELIKL
jgi:OOP family OmpA-OmpF porin